MKDESTTALTSFLDHHELPVMLWRRPEADTGDPHLVYANSQCSLEWNVDFSKYFDHPYADVAHLLTDQNSRVDVAGVIVEAFREQGHDKSRVFVRFSTEGSRDRTFQLSLNALTDDLVAMTFLYPFRELLEVSNDTLSVLTAEGELLYRTPSAYTNFGFEVGEESARNIQSITDAENFFRITEFLETLIRRPGESEKAVFRRKQKDGAWRDIEVIVTNRLEDENIQGLIVNSRDVTDRVEAQTRIEEMNAELEAFAYRISHDLKTPLRLIRSYLERRVNTAPDEGGGLMLETMDQMILLINDLLAFSRLGRKPLEKEQVNFSSTAQGVVRELLEVYSLDPSSFRVAPNILCVADATLLRNVLKNLLENSVKFARDGVHLHIEIAAEEQTEGRVFFVRDNGIGMSIPEPETPFGLFQRLQGSEEIDGSGIGLATVKRIIERHDGRIWAESKPNEGSTVYFTLPEETGPQEDSKE